MNRPHLKWLRESILQHLSTADRTIADLMPRDDEDSSYCEPWLTELFNRRRVLQTTLYELEQQIGQLST